MKRFITLYALTLISTVSFSQKQLNDTIPLRRWQFSVNIGAAGMSGLPSSMDRQSSVGIEYDIHYNIRLAKHHYLTIGAGYQSENYVVDGVFTQTGNTYQFGNTPDNYKQNEISIGYVQFPMMYKYQFFGSSVSFGPYAAIVVNSKNRYKIQSTKYKVDMPIQNKFQMGLQLDLQWYLPAPNKAGTQAFLFGLGAQHQLTNYLSDQSSFKPFFAYAKFGVSLR